ncbi:MAG: hypothetical protein EPN70_03260 [Paraburkholderia sp.]|uniref:hypothetical protein n=1 Tax=Paraburkholderia sp. TaxID=1926495 RepID=UPI001219245A|nr:hypothetical protein [Paraburkholderia sp.]TAM07283.1 MAG: hypothetical protein EPN70_03260 [Paraburkholderia sp.]
MTLKFIAETLNSIAAKRSALGQLTFDQKGPHHLAHGIEAIRPQWKFSGVYVLTKPSAPEWNLDFKESDAEVWYVGMTASDIFQCMLRHFGPLLGNSPVAYGHRWTNGSAPPDIESCLAKGEVVLYPIEVRSSEPELTKKQSGLLPGLVEKQLLVAYADRYGSLPPLNLSM